MKYKILISPQAKKDIQLAIEWYNDQKPDLGKNFHSVLNSHIENLRNNPFYQIRYDKVRCLPIKQYPYMIHFTLDESKNIVVIRAIFNTSIDPTKWKERR